MLYHDKQSEEIYICVGLKKTALCTVQIEPSCKIIPKEPTTQIPCECLITCDILPMSFIVIQLKNCFANIKICY